MAGFRASAIGASNNSKVTSSTITVPAEAVASDYAVIEVGHTEGAVTLTVPTGWTLLAGPHGLASTSSSAWMLGKSLVAGDVGATVKLVFSVGGRVSSQMNVYSDVDPATLVVGTAVVEGSSDASVTFPSVASVPAGAIFHIGTMQRTSSGSPIDVAIASPYLQGSKPWHGTTSPSSNVSTEGAYQIVATTGTKGGETFPLTTGSSLGVTHALVLPDSSTAAPVVANFTATSARTGDAPLTVALNADESGGTPPYTWAWDYGDGTFGTASSPNHEYVSAGTYTVSVTVTDSLGASDTETKVDYVTVTAPGTGTDPGPLGSPMSTVDLLARTDQMAPTGIFTDRWADSSPPADRTYDFRGAEHQGFFLADPVLGYKEWDTANGGRAATAHEKNLKPISIAETTPTARIGVVGGKVIGDQARTYTWNSHKHGTPCQDDLDAGIPKDTVWATWSGKNTDGDARFRISEGSWVIVDGLRADNTHDGVGFYTQNNAITDTGSVWLRNLWIKFCHDDAIENDRAYLTLDVYDSLFERIHSFLSVSGNSGSPGTGKTQTIRKSIVWLEAKPGPYQEMTSFLGHGAFYKDRDNSPPLVMSDCILAADKPRTTSQLTLPTGTGCSYTNVTIVWLGTGTYPGNTPDGCTVTTDRKILDDAVADWYYRHGVTDFDNVDMSLMIAPRPSNTGGALPEGPLPGFIDGVEPEAHGHCPPMCDSNGNLYRISEEFGPATEVPNHNSPMMFRSTDGGSTWAQQDAANRPTDNDLESDMMLQVGTSILFIFSDGGFVSYNQYNTSDAAVDPDKWVVKNEKGITGLSTPSQLQTSAVRLSDGRTRVFFSEAGPNVSFITRAAAGGWSAKTTLGAGRGGRVITGVGDKAHILYHDYVGKTVQYRTLTSADVLSSAVRVDTQGTNTATRNYNAVSNAVYYDAAGVEVIAALYTSASTGLRLIQIANGVVTDEQVDTTLPLISPANLSGNTQNDGPVCSLAVDGTTLHVLFTDGTDIVNNGGDLIHKSRPHGGVWSARTVLWNAPAGRHASWTYANVFTRGLARVLGYTYDDGPHDDNDSNIYYNRVLLSEVASAGRAFDVWDGSVLVARRKERWDGAALALAKRD